MEHPELKKKRLLLRKFQAEDCDEIQRLAGNYNVAKMTLNIPHPYVDGMAEIWIKEHHKKMESGIQVTYAISNMENDKLLGAISLTEIQNQEASLGYWIGEEYWGKGYCSEVAIRLISYAFTVLGLHRVHAQHLTCNPASGKVMLNAGMEYLETVAVEGRKGEYVSMEYYEAMRTL